jgi:hypothetical protein
LDTLDSIAKQGLQLVMRNTTQNFNNRFKESDLVGNLLFDQGAFDFPE